MKWMMMLGLVFPLLGLAGMSPARSNESVVVAKVVQYTIEGEDNILYSLGLRIISSASVRGLPNFTKERIGKTIVAYSKQPLSPQLFGRQIEARIKYIGDESKGMFWIIEIK